MQNPHSIKFQTSKNKESILRLRLFILDALVDGRPRTRRVVVDEVAGREKQHQRKTRASRHCRTDDDLRFTIADYIDKMKEDGFVKTQLPARRIYVTDAGLEFLKRHHTEVFEREVANVNQGLAEMYGEAEETRNAWELRKEK